MNMQDGTQDYLSYDQRPANTLSSAPSFLQHSTPCSLTQSDQRRVMRPVSIPTQRLLAKHATLKRVCLSTQQSEVPDGGDCPSSAAYVIFAGTGVSNDLDHTYVEWTTTIETPGTYLLRWRYALADQPCPLVLMINHITVLQPLLFPQTASWADWNIFGQIVTLKAGPTAIRLSALGCRGCNIDYLDIDYLDIDYPEIGYWAIASYSHALQPSIFVPL